MRGCVQQQREFVSFPRLSGQHSNVPPGPADQPIVTDAHAEFTIHSAGRGVAGLGQHALLASDAAPEVTPTPAAGAGITAVEIGGGTSSTDQLAG